MSEINQDTIFLHDLLALEKKLYSAQPVDCEIIYDVLFALIRNIRIYYEDKLKDPANDTP